MFKKIFNEINDNKNGDTFHHHILTGRVLATQNPFKLLLITYLSKLNSIFKKINL